MIFIKFFTSGRALSLLSGTRCPRHWTMEGENALFPSSAPQLLDDRQGVEPEFALEAARIKQTRVSRSEGFTKRHVDVPILSFHFTLQIGHDHRFARRV